MSSIATSNLTSGFIDLATYDEVEKYLYGGPDATAYFVRQTRKSTWFTQVPVVLSRASGQPQFGQEWSVQISRAGDYLLYSWLRVVIPAVKNTFVGASGATGPGATGEIYIGWTPNLLHNLVVEASITFNDLVAASFNSVHLDFWSAFTTPPGKVDGYYQMVGTLTDLTNIYGYGETIPETTLNLPLPLFFARDSGVALPTAALPYNDMRINFVFNDWTRLLNQYNIVADPTYNNRLLAMPLYTPNWNASSDFVPPQLSVVQVWANYAIVSNDERKRMACAPRDILIEQVQTAPPQTYAPISQPNPSYDIRFSHAIKVLFFGARNTSVRSYGSNYTTQHSIPVFQQFTKRDVYYPANYFPGSDPINTTSLTYENTQRLSLMGSDYFSLVQPYYTAPIIPIITGYHVYSYSLDFISLDPLGSTNYGKLTNVSIAPTPSDYATWSATQDPLQDATFTTDIKTWVERYPDWNTALVSNKNIVYPNTYSFFVTAVNNNIIRISGGKHPRVPPTVSSHYGCGKTILEKECNFPLIPCF
jgi:hypothetical protein